MTYEQLLTLETIVEKGSFKAASSALNKTQPSLSVAIKKLEEEFNVLLFNRDEYRPTLTEQGKTFYRWAKNSLRTFRELEVVGKELGNQAIEPSLEIILDPLVRFEAVQPVFQSKSDFSTVTEFHFRSEVFSAGMERLLEGQADFAIAPKLKDHEDIESVPFENLKLIPVVSKKLLNNEKVDYTWLRTRRQIIVMADEDKKTRLSSDSYGMVGEGSKCYVNDHAMKRNLILNGFGWGRLSTHEVENELRRGMLVEIKHDSVTPFILKLHIMRNRAKSMGPVAKVIWKQLLAQCEARPINMKSKSKK